MFSEIFELTNTLLQHMNFRDISKTIFQVVLLTIEDYFNG